jgi:hypothetical protein
MVLELGATTGFIRVTPEYSNAVVTALLPYYSDFAKKLSLPISVPIKTGDVAHWAIAPEVAKDGGIYSVAINLKNGFQFYFAFGYVTGFSRGNSYYGLQNPDEIPKYYGHVKMTTNEAVQLARNTIKKIGVSLEDVFANQEPKVMMPPKIGSNTVPRYQVEWLDPRGGHVRMEINAETKQVEVMHTLTPNLMRPSPIVKATPPKGRGMFDAMMPPKPNPDYAWQLIPIALKAIEEYSEKLSLPIPRPLTTNKVAVVELHDNGGWPHCDITLTNGWRFVYRHCMVNGYYTPNVLFTKNNMPLHLKDFTGKWNLNTNQAIELVKKTLAKMDYPTNNIHMNFAPGIIYPPGDFRKTIPRLWIEWYYENRTGDDLESKVEAEVNADTGKLESLYYDDKAYWDCRPPIDVPISEIPEAPARK